MSDESLLILVVDDTEATRYSVSRVLKRDGFRVIEAETGYGGLALARAERPDLVILDIHLPDILGFEVCKRLKAAPATAHIPVLQISASYVTAKDRVDGLEGGADSYLTHPVEPQVLVATVRALLRLRDLNRKVAVTDERLAMALSVAPISLFELDHELRFRWLHGPRRKLTTDDVIGKRIDEIHPSSDSRALLATQAEILQTGIAQRVIYKLREDGQDRFFDVRMEPVREGDKVTGLVCAAVDATEREFAKIEIERARDAAESANSAKTQFIANVSHEIRTPLGVILGFSDLILDSNVGSDDDDIKSVGVIKRNAIQLSKLIDEVLDLSKIEADRMEIESIRFDVAEVVVDVISLLSLQAREKGVKLDALFNGPLPKLISGDPTRLRQILINLVGNAVKFTAAGRISMTVQTASPPVEGQPVSLYFDVKDSGIGISAEQSQKLFSAFTQADASTSRRFGGTGLGLMLSRKIAEAMGGELTLLESEPGTGSVFRLTLTEPHMLGESQIVPNFNSAQSVEQESARSGMPVSAALKKSLASAAASTAAAATDAYEQPLARLAILLVEDAPDNQVMIQRFLTNAGAVVSIASNGLEGVTQATSQTFNVVFMDVQMPVMDGYAAVRELRRLGYSAPIVALTAHALKGERERCISAGFSDYLTKPVNRQLLIEKARQLAQ